MSHFTKVLRVNPPDSPDGEHFQLQEDGGGHGEVVGYSSWEEWGVNRREAEENAYLWAAAPDLLNRLKALLSVYGDNWAGTTRDDVVSLIARAEGK